MCPQSWRWMVSKGGNRQRSTTHFVPATRAFVTETADSTGFKGDPISRFQVGHFCANFFRNISDVIVHNSGQNNQP